MIREENPQKNGIFRLQTELMATTDAMAPTDSCPTMQVKSTGENDTCSFIITKANRQPSLRSLGAKHCEIPQQWRLLNTLQTLISSFDFQKVLNCKVMK